MTPNGLSQSRSGFAHFAVLCAALLLALAPIAHAQRPAAPPSEQRIALVVGNSSYAESPLRNPVNDATDVAAALRTFGFTVLLRTNANRRQMVEAVREFGSQIRRGGVGFFYYAGHGVQSRGKNYLIPVGAQLQAEGDLEFEAVDANMVLAQMDEAGNRVNVIVLDACRDNPFARSFRSASRGLAQMDTAKGSFLAYATSPGSVAADGSGRNGTYTKHLLASLNQPDSKLEEVFKRVRLGVAQETANRQIPWDSSSVLGDFYFRPPEGGAPPPVAAPAPAPAPAPGGDPLAVELAFWQAAKESNDPAQLRAYLQRYPNGEFAALARLRLDGGPSLATQASRAQAVQALIDSLPGAAFEASSTWSEDPEGHGPANARYSSTGTMSNWSANFNFIDQWLQVDLQRVSTVRAIGTKGRHNVACFLFIQCLQWVRSYQFAYSVDGKSWQFVDDGGKPRLFQGNGDSHTEVRHELREPIKARYLRFHPRSWSMHITMRVEAYGYAE